MSDLYSTTPRVVVNPREYVVLGWYLMFPYIFIRRARLTDGDALASAIPAAIATLAIATQFLSTTAGVEDQGVWVEI